MERTGVQKIMKQNEFTNIIRQILYCIFGVVFSLIIILGLGIYQVFNNLSEYSISASQNENVESNTNMNIGVDNENASRD